MNASNKNAGPGKDNAREKDRNAKGKKETDEHRNANRHITEAENKEEYESGPESKGNRYNMNEVKPVDPGQEDEEPGKQAEGPEKSEDHGPHAGQKKNPEKK